jgi:hypothetical protein
MQAIKNIDPLFVVSVIRVESRFAADPHRTKTPRINANKDENRFVVCPKVRA